MGYPPTSLSVGKHIGSSGVAPLRCGDAPAGGATEGGLGMLTGKVGAELGSPTHLHLQISPKWSDSENRGSGKAVWRTSATAPPQV